MAIWLFGILNINSLFRTLPNPSQNGKTASRRLSNPDFVHFQANHLGVALSVTWEFRLLFELANANSVFCTTLLNWL